jgi:integrase
MLNSLHKKGETLFGPGLVRDKEHSLQAQRERLAEKINNPRLARITFHTLRHWKGTMEYHKTQSPDNVKHSLGHRNLSSTEIYFNMEQALFTEKNQDFHVKAVATLDEACKLLELGFEYVCEMDGQKLFRKRK